MKQNYTYKKGKGGKPKIFVLDTNIILHDHKAIWHFADNDLVIPLAVIEELDKFKKGNDSLSYNARGFMRDINKLTDRREFGPEGIPLGNGLGSISIVPNHQFPEEFKDLFVDDIPDHRILATAMWVRDQHPDRFTAIVSMDINLRLKAKSAGMPAQDYLSDKVEDDTLENSLKEVVTIDNADPERVQALLYGQDNCIDYHEISEKEPWANQLYKFNWEGETVCARYDTDRNVIALVRSREAYGIRPRNDEHHSLAELVPERLLSPLQQLWSRKKTLIRSFSPVRPWFLEVRISASFRAIRRVRCLRIFSLSWIILTSSADASSREANRPSRLTR